MSFDPKATPNFNALEVVQSFTPRQRRKGKHLRVRLANACKSWLNEWQVAAEKIDGLLISTVRIRANRYATYIGDRDAYYEIEIYKTRGAARNGHNTHAAWLHTHPTKVAVGSKFKKLKRI